MNTIEALRQVLNYAVAPDWSKAPEWAQWYAIDADGEGCWYAVKPTFDFSSRYWRNNTADWQFDCVHDIGSIISILSPLTLFWQRPEAQ